MRLNPPSLNMVHLLQVSNQNEDMRKVREPECGSRQEVVVLLVEKGMVSNEEEMVVLMMVEIIMT